MSTKERKLKPCPFCGRPPLRIRTFSGYGAGIEYRVDHSCYAFMSLFSSEEEAIKAWNTRYDEKKKC